MISALVEEFAKEAGRRGIRRRVAEQAARVRRSFPEALAYGAGGALAFPSIQRVHSLIEHRGKPPPVAQFYQIGKRRISTRVPAAATAGFLAAGVIPYLQDFVKARRAQRKLTTVNKARTAPGLGKSAALISPSVFKAPQFRGRVKARIAEASKSFAAKRFRMARTTGVIMPGEHRI
jgi:hypothetical protein